MNANELKLLMELLRETRADVRALDEFIREHMVAEEGNLKKIDERLSKLEWKVHGLSAAAGMVGGFVAMKIKALFGIDTPGGV